jgi:hypothetical protein
MIQSGEILFEEKIDTFIIACVAQWESIRLKILRLGFDSLHRHF